MFVDRISLRALSKNDAKISWKWRNTEVLKEYYSFLEKLGEPMHLIDGNPTAERIARLIFEFFKINLCLFSIFHNFKVAIDNRRILIPIPILMKLSVRR